MKTIRSKGGSIIPLAAFLLLALGFSPVARAEGNAKGLLDGKVFVVESGKMGRKPDGKDTLIFKDGKFRSANCDRYGFGHGVYTSTMIGDTITFATDTSSESSGTIRWEGTVRGDTIDVRYTWIDPARWYKPNPKPREHWARSIPAWALGPGATSGGITASRLLDGKTFYVQTGEKGKKSDHGDYLVFRDGMLLSTGCLAYGFRETAYTATTDGDGIRFRVEMVSPAYGHWNWEGTVRGDVLDATARWTRDRWYWKIDRVYWFRGRLQT
jgi:hypothetical protein